MDGPAFHNAREGIERLKERHALYGVTGLGAENALVEASLDLFSYHRAKWQFNRLAILSGMLKGESVSSMQRKLGITEQAVYRNIRDGRLETVAELLAETAKWCDRALEGGDAD